MRILIITLYYEPLNNIAVTRIKAFKKYLTEFGHHVDILTRHYSEEDMNSSNLDIGLLDGDDLGGEYYKINDVIYSKFKTTNSKLSLSNKLPKGIKGLYNLNQLDVFHYSFVEFGIKAYEKEFKHHTHDLIIASSPAPAVLLLAKEIYKKFGVKWIADFRDSYISGEESKTILNVKKRALTKVLSSSSALLFVSEGMLELNKKYLNPKIFKKPHIIIRNGFYCANDKLDTKVLQQIKNIKSNYNKLLVYTGTIYPERNLDFFINSINKSQQTQTAIIVVGVQKTEKERIKKMFPKVNVFFFDKVSQFTATKIQKTADFLLLSIWKNYYTGFSGKVFEYLYSGNKIILDYAPPKDLKNYLKEFPNIYYCNGDENKFFEIINSNHKTKEVSKNLKDALLREKQVQKLNLFLKKEVFN